MPSRLKREQAKAKAKEEEEEEEQEEGQAEEDTEDADQRPEMEIEPYTVLGLDRAATADQVKSAYRKAALKYHPDKVAAADKDEAHKRFQQVALAYAVLSDERRRRRYDATGNTAESLDDDDDFNWTDFFREQTAALVDGAALDKIRSQYQGSDEERRDLLRAYEEHAGDMDAVYEEIMCSSVLDDDDRFRRIIDAAIADGTVQPHKAYVKETAERRGKRRRKAEHEADEALALAEELGVRDRLFGTSSSSSSSSSSSKPGKAGKASKASKASKADGEDALKALIQQRQQGRAASFIDRLEAKYGGGGGGTAKRKTTEPPEAAFQKNAKKAKAKT